MYHYVYKLIHNESGEFYIGSRSSLLHPSIDGYMGSMKTWKINKTTLIKEILKEGFLTIDELREYEKMMIEESIDDPLNRNYHIPPIQFRTNGMVPVRDKNDKTFLVSVNDDRYISGELVHAAKGTQIGQIVVIDKDGYKFKVDKNDPRYLSGEIKSHLIGLKIKLNKRLDPNHSSKFTQIGKLNSQYGTMWIHNKKLGKNAKIKKNAEIPADWEIGRIQKHWNNTENSSHLVINE
jgi:hypothetical protein